MIPFEQVHRSRARERAPDDDWVMPFSLWCDVNNFSLATGRRLRKAGKGPVFTQISERKVGVTIPGSGRNPAPKADRPTATLEALGRAISNFPRGNSE
jgi:hypothetical protein